MKAKSRRCSIPLIVSLLFSMFLFLSCGFEPAWKSQDTTVSFRLGPAARAIAPGGGYLYVRPLGGPLGTGPKSYLGPIELGAGDTFTTTEIAPGSYDGFVVMYSLFPIDDLMWGAGAPIPYSTVMSLDDNTFVRDVEELSCFDAVGFDLGITLAITDPVSVVEKETNTIHALLVPQTDESEVVTTSYFSPALSVGRHRVFIQLDGLATFIDNTPPEPRMTINLLGTQSSELHSVSFYGSEGDKRSVDFSSGNFDESNAQQFYMPWNGIDTSVFIYLDYTGAGISMDFMED